MKYELAILIFNIYLTVIATKRVLLRNLGKPVGLTLAVNDKG